MKFEFIRWGVAVVLLFALSFALMGCGTDCAWKAGFTCYHVI